MPYTSGRLRSGQRLTQQANSNTTPAVDVPHVNSHIPIAHIRPKQDAQEFLKAMQQATRLFDAYQGVKRIENREDRKEAHADYHADVPLDDERSQAYIEEYRSLNGQSDALSYRREATAFAEANRDLHTSELEKGLQEIRSKYLDNRPDAYISGFGPSAEATTEGLLSDRNKKDIAKVRQNHLTFMSNAIVDVYEDMIRDDNVFRTTFLRKEITRFHEKYEGILTKDEINEAVAKNLIELGVSYGDLRVLKILKAPDKDGIALRQTGKIGSLYLKGQAAILDAIEREDRRARADQRKEREAITIGLQGEVSKIIEGAKDALDLRTFEERLEDAASKGKLDSTDYRYFDTWLTSQKDGSNIISDNDLKLDLDARIYGGEESDCPTIPDIRHFYANHDLSYEDASSYIRAISQREEAMTKGMFNDPWYRHMTKQVQVTFPRREIGPFDRMGVSAVEGFDYAAAIMHDVNKRLLMNDETPMDQIFQEEIDRWRKVAPDIPGTDSNGLTPEEEAKLDTPIKRLLYRAQKAMFAGQTPDWGNLLSQAQYILGEPFLTLDELRERYIKPHIKKKPAPAPAPVRPPSFSDPLRADTQAPQYGAGAMSLGEALSSLVGHLGKRDVKPEEVMEGWKRINKRFNPEGLPVTQQVIGRDLLGKLGEYALDMEIPEGVKEVFTKTDATSEELAEADRRIWERFNRK